MKSCVCVCVCIFGSAVVSFPNALLYFCKMTCPSAKGNHRKESTHDNVTNICNLCPTCSSFHRHWGRLSDEDKQQRIVTSSNTGPRKPKGHLHRIFFGEQNCTMLVCRTGSYVIFAMVHPAMACTALHLAVNLQPYLERPLGIEPRTFSPCMQSRSFASIALPHKKM